MSVTIYPTQPGTFRRFPRRVVSRPCDACARGYCQPGWCVDGIEHDEQPTTPECNVGHVNTPALLRAVGLPSDPSLCGAIDASEVAGVLADCEAALRSDAPGLVARAGMLRAGHDSERLYVAARDDRRATEQLARLRDVLVWALENGAGIAWD